MKEYRKPAGINMLKTWLDFARPEATEEIFATVLKPNMTYFIKFVRLGSCFHEPLNNFITDPENMNWGIGRPNNK